MCAFACPTCRSRLVIALLSLSLLLACSVAYCQRVLVVTTEQANPNPGNSRIGTFAFTDLVCAGLPFDVRTYGRFLTMDMSPYDVIILNGYTSPTPVDQVSQRCQTLLTAGKKIFINGYQPFMCYDSAGTTYTWNYYGDELFNAQASGGYVVSGVATAPAFMQKDSLITAVGVSNAWVQTFVLQSPAPIEIRIGGKLVGFIGPNGGAIRGYSDYEYHLLDYGKLVNYLRHGDPMIVGFANDRDGGLPIVAFHTDCHIPSSASAVNGLADLSARYNLPLDNTLTLWELNSAGAQLWNSITSPLMAVGSHTRTHPNNWPDLTVPTGLDSETRQAISDQRATRVPRTLNYLTFSGGKNPNAEELDQLTQWGVLFDGQGQGGRYLIRPDGTRWDYQVMPINGGWLKNLALCQNTPTWPSETLISDTVSFQEHLKYDEMIATAYAQNVKYGIYSYGYFHDVYADPNTEAYVEGLRMSVYIDRAMQWLRDQNVRFMFPHELIPRVQDYIAGSISYVTNPDGSITVTATRPNALVNEIKIGFKGDLTPAASGASVVSQMPAGECLYVKLAAETTSTVQVGFTLLLPLAPVVTSNQYISNASEVSWTEPVHGSGIAEYQFAVGTTPGGTDAQGWTSAGAATSALLTQAQLQDGMHYYVSVKARYASTDWGAVGVSGMLTADMTPPAKPVVTDSGKEQDDSTALYASWTSLDAQSGIVQYCFAIGTAPGDTSIVPWTYTTDSEAFVGGLYLEIGQTYYFSVKAKNGVGLWSDVGASDGIKIVPVGPMTVGRARRRPESAFVEIDGCVVTAVFTGSFYVESPDRSAGLCVYSGSERLVGEKLNLSGYMGSDDIGRIVYPVEPIPVVETGVVVEPVTMTNSNLGGKGDSLVYGPVGGGGLNNVGLLVKTLGKITVVEADCIFIDDGAHLEAGGGRTGVRVSVTSPNSFGVGSYVSAVGISSLVQDGAVFRRFVLTRSNADITVLNP